MLEMIKKHKVLICIAVILLIAGVPLLIHLLFKIDINILFFQAEWTAGEILQYYASILTLVPTTILSMAALNYTISSKIDDDKWKKKINAGIICNEKIKVYFSDAKLRMCNISIEFENKGDAYPDGALLKSLVITRDDNFHMIGIPCYRKSYCNVWNSNNNTFELSMYIDEYPENVLDDNIIKQVIKCFERGLITEKELENRLFKRVELEIGLYCGNVVTPIKICLDMHYIYDFEYLINYKYAVDKCKFKIKPPMIDKSFEKEAEFTYKDTK